MNLRRPAFAVGSDTSFHAAESMRQGAETLRAKVFALIFAAGKKGMTCDELEAATGLRHQTASARVNELHRDKHIKDSGERRRTRSGRYACVWRVDR